MKKSEKIIGINLLILLGYAVLVFAMTEREDRHAGLAFSIFYGFILATHVFTLTVIAIGRFLSKKPTDGKAWLLGALAVLVIGFSSCYGGVVMLN